MTSKLIQDIHKNLGLSESQIERIIVRSPHSYKVYEIPKRNGGTRVIAQPAKETKLIQHWLIANVFINLPIHSAATAYKTGASIKKNALAHAGNSYLSKFDFSNFFPSIKIKHLQTHLEAHLSNIYSIEDIELIARLSCIHPKKTNDLCLSVGAPSSPLLSNSIMYSFDESIDSWCKDNKITYTRYADDLSFSSNVKEISNEIEKKLRLTVSQLKSPKIKINDEKTIHLSKKNQRFITGIVINNNNEISLGRERKRLISAMIHKYKVHELNEELYPKLQGLLGFSLDVEPIFFHRMKEKYGEILIENIMKHRK